MFKINDIILFSENYATAITLDLSYSTYIIFVKQNSLYLKLCYCNQRSNSKRIIIIANLNII